MTRVSGRRIGQDWNPDHMTPQSVNTKRGFTMKLMELNFQGPLLIEAFFDALGRTTIVMCSCGHYKICKSKVFQ